MSQLIGDWTFDIHVVVAVGLALAYMLAVRRRSATDVEPARRWGFYLGCLIWLYVSCSSVEVFAHKIFWVRAVQIVVLLYLVPMLLAFGKPLTAFGVTSVKSKAMVVLTYPLTASALLLVTPWLLIFTSWNLLSMQNHWLDAVTRIVIVACGFVYFYARLQVDPLPRIYPQGVSLVITVVEGLADGVLGLMVWMGPKLYVSYYMAQGLTYHQIDLYQVIGAGMLWILADIIGLPFLMLLMLSLKRQQQKAAEQSDIAEDNIALECSGQIPSTQSGLWWENDPQLADRYKSK